MLKNQKVVDSVPFWAKGQMEREYFSNFGFEFHSQEFEPYEYVEGLLDDETDACITEQLWAINEGLVKEERPDGN